MHVLLILIILLLIFPALARGLGCLVQTIGIVILLVILAALLGSG